MPAGSDSAQSVGSGEIRVGLYPFEIPQYLMRPNIVTMPEGNRLEIAEYDRWAESLDASLMRVLDINLTRMVPRASVHHYPWRREPGVLYEISGEVLQFGLEDDGIVRMIVHWTLRPAGDADGEDHRFVFARPPVGEGFVGIVTMMNQAVNALSEEIAAELNRMVGSAERPGE
jgi:uncharacterized lipoprotein YmbA